MSTTTSTTTQLATHTVQAQEDSIPPAESSAAFQALARGDKNGNIKLRGIPSVTDPLAKRQWVREHMAAAFRFFGRQGYGEGVSGHISVRGSSSASSY